jgi:hypothetical protein
MATFKLASSTGVHEFRVLLGDYELDRDTAYFTRHENAGFLHLVAPLTVAVLSAELRGRDPRIERLFLSRVRLTLLDVRWQADIAVFPESRYIALRCRPHWERWTSVIDFDTLRNAFIDVVQNSKTEVIDTTGGDLAVRFRMNASPSSLSDVLNACELHLSAHVRTAFERAASDNPAAVVGVFNFPAPVRSACEQYLLHFVDFLRDVGVDATGDIRHEAGRVLFTVTPTDSKHALTTIRHALATYLAFVGASLDGESEILSDQLAIEKLRMNILHLKSQLTAAGMMLRLQEATISAQELTIDAQQRLLAGTPTSHDDSEVLVPGIVDVVRVESHGMRVNLPALLRRLKELFQRR